MSRNDTAKRPDKPRPDHPCFPHARGYWCKKVGGRQVVFTRWSEDPRGELAERMWREQEERIRAGLPPIFPDDESNASLAAIWNAFLDDRQGRITEREWAAYRDAGRRVCSLLGADVNAGHLTPDDFRRLRRRLELGASGKVGPVTLKGRMRRVRTVLNWAARDGILEAAPKYGAGFDPPTKADERRAKAGAVENVFTADEIRAMLDAADDVRRCWVLLGINAALGNRDLSDLRWSHLEQRAGWLVFPRNKTGIERAAPLWRQTSEAIDAIERNGAASSDRVFRTARGHALVREYATEKAISRHDRVGDAFRRLLDEAGIERNGPRGYYGLRSSFATVASGAGDPHAVKQVMGHSRGDDITSRYVRLVGEAKDDRLRKVVDRVRAWLFGEEVRDV